jgi:hypothetical protein
MAPAMQYDVFLSHCGADCKQDFAVILKQELERAGIRCFLDKRDLQLGDDAAQKMLLAMKTACIGIAILSEGFFSREWCVKELHTFVARKNPVQPIFLGIGPGDLKGFLEKVPAVWETFKRFPMTKEEYARGITAAADFTGERLEVVGGFWDTCIMRVKESLLRLLDKVGGGVRICEAGVLVGIGGHLVRMKQLLGLPVATASVKEAGSVTEGGPVVVREIAEAMAFEGNGSAILAQHTEDLAGKEIGIVGVNGMGGVGKTTLAKRIYDDPNVRQHFGGRVCWVEVNQDPSQAQICELQKQILHDLCRVSEEIGNPSIGRAKIRDRLNGAKVLVCLDNVWDDEGSNGVLRLDCLGPGSRILKTTRDDKLIGVEERYNLDVMDSDAALELFCWHAFSGQEPPPRLKQSVERAVECCGGLPLALELMGARVAEETRRLDDASRELWWEVKLLLGLENHELEHRRFRDVHQCLRTSNSASMHCQIRT